MPVLLTPLIPLISISLKNSVTGVDYR
jgi:hypothetical protein